MLEIKPLVDKQQIAPFCKKAKRPVSEAYYVYTATDHGETLAACLFEVQSDHVSAVHYEAQDAADAYMLDALLRSGFNYASEFGLVNGCIPEDFRYLHRALFSRLNFPKESMFNISNFFQKYKNCSKVADL